MATDVTIDGPTLAALDDGSIRLLRRALGGLERRWRERDWIQGAAFWKQVRAVVEAEADRRRWHAPASAATTDLGEIGSELGAQDLARLMVMVQHLRDDRQNPDPERAVWAELLAELDEMRCDAAEAMTRLHRAVEFDLGPGESQRADWWTSGLQWPILGTDVLAADPAQAGRQGADEPHTLADVADPPQAGHSPTEEVA